MSNHIHIPNEIIINILARLPVLSLLRFTPACKLWYSIITNPKFIATHLNQTPERSTVQLFVSVYDHRGSQTKYLLINEDDKTHTELAFPSGLRNLSKNNYVVGTCNGLICLAEGHPERARHAIIWNPTIRKSVTLTFPEKQYHKQYTLLMGFGFVLGKNNYKVMRIVCGPYHSWVEVYEQGGEWRVKGCAPPSSCQRIIINLTPTVFVLGALHWLAYDITPPRSIIVFDMRDEVFREIRLPPNLPQHLPSIKITSFDGSLALLYNEYCSIGNVELWVMRGYGVLGYWTKMYDIVLPSCLHVPLDFRKGGEILLLNNKIHGAIGWYDPETKSYTSLCIQNYPFISEMHYFVESLVLLEGEKAVTDQFAHLL